MADAPELDWEDLRFFLRASEAKTLAGAARAMGVEHTTVGRRLSALERSLGAPLVLRGPSGLALTPLGAKVATAAADVERIVRAVLELARSERARVRLAVPSGFTAFFAPRLAAFAERHPGIVVELVSGARPVDLEKGEADLAVRIGPVRNEDLVARKLCDVGWALYAGRAYAARRPLPRDADDLGGHEIVAYDAALAALPAARWLEERSRAAKVVLRGSEMVDLISAVASGVGLGVLACALADGRPELVRITPSVVATRSAWLVYRREARLAAPVRQVARFVIGVAREEERLFRGAPP